MNHSHPEYKYRKVCQSVRLPGSIACATSFYPKLIGSFSSWTNRHLWPKFQVRRVVGRSNHILSAKPLVSEPTPMLSTSSQNCLCMHHQKGQKLLRYYSFRARGGRERQHRLLIAVDCLPHISHFDNFASRWRLLLDPTLESGDFSLFPDMCTFVLRRTP